MINNQSKGEEIANAITHGLGAIFSIGGTAILIVLAVLTKDIVTIAAMSVYGASLILLYTMSTLYHTFTKIEVKRVFQIFDHCSIFLLILGTYTPFCLITLEGSVGWTLFLANAFFAILGIILNVISIKKYQKFSLVLYLLMGWSVIFAIKPVYTAISSEGLWLLALGGISYTVGVIFFVAKKPKYMHSVWHLFVLTGSILHYFSILFYVLP